MSELSSLRDSESASSFRVVHWQTAPPSDSEETDLREIDIRSPSPMRVLTTEAMTIDSEAHKLETSAAFLVVGGAALDNGGEHGGDDHGPGGDHGGDDHGGDHGASVTEVMTTTRM